MLTANDFDKRPIFMTPALEQEVESFAQEEAENHTDNVNAFITHGQSLEIWSKGECDPSENEEMGLDIQMRIKQRFGLNFELRSWGKRCASLIIDEDQKFIWPKGLRP